ncbi:hypothetical protein RNJ44_01918 [Nakaseomyces bracarensis]|uniref:Uncharacterized protein n=1 Tax=Nakaseomyces bracarensis TaxID=273131 RepID=A0ABR4NP46_9SACH
MKLSVSYGLIPPNSRVNSHILPITKIIHPVLNDKPYFLTCGRDGSVVLHKGPTFEDVNNGIRMQVHSDWVSDIIEVGKNKFITVSHDFSIVLIMLSDDLDSWQMQIVGDHDDYIKCVVPLYHSDNGGNHHGLLNSTGLEPSADGVGELNVEEQMHRLSQQLSRSDTSDNEIENENENGETVEAEVKSTYFHFATGALDRKVKVWRLDNLNNRVVLLHTFDNTQPDDMGSIYAMASLNKNDIAMYMNPEEYKEKVTDGTGFTENEVPDTDSDSEFVPDSDMPFDLIVGDCNGNLIFYSTEHLREFTRLKNAHMSNIKVLKVIDDSTKLLSTCSDGVIQLWDLDSTAKAEDGKPVNIGCWNWNASIWCITGSYSHDLFFGDSKGRIVKLDLSNFAEKNTDVTMEIIFNKDIFKNELSDSESKVQATKRQKGILDLICIQNRDLYFSFCTDSNLNKYRMLTNDLDVKKGGFALTRSSLLTNRRHVITENTKGEIQRWDILSCDLLDTFPSSEGTFDEIVVKYTSKEILSHWCTVSVKVGMLYVKVNEKFMGTEVYGSALKDYEMMRKIDLDTDERYNLGKIAVNSLFYEFVGYELDKDKIWRKKLVTKRKDHGSTRDNSNIEMSASPQEKGKDKWKKSAFNKFLGSGGSNMEALELVTENENSENELYETPPLSPGQLNDKNIDEVIQPTAHKNFSGRTMSSGSLLSRKFKSFRSNSNRNITQNNEAGNNDNPTEMSERENSVFGSHNVSGTTTKDGTPEYINWNHPFKSEHSRQNTVSYTNLVSRLQPSESSRSNSIPAAGAFIASPAPINYKEEFMSDLISEIHDQYQKEYLNNNTSLKILGRKAPESKLRRDISCPIIKARRGCLLLVHSWKDGACGGRVVFSAYLPVSRSEEEQEEGLKKIKTEEEETEGHISDDDKLKKYDYIENTDGNVLSRRCLFELLEMNLPFWMGKTLLTESKRSEEQPRLNFTIVPWQPASNNDLTNNFNDEQSKTLTNGDGLQQPQPTKHNVLKFGKSKFNENNLSPTDLPKISETNMKLVAPGMIKVKKIKNYVVDRFENKTPEMKSKQDPSEWLEILCKDQVLDNDMTLGTIRSLFWKSQSDIVLQYRRKPTSS